MDVSLDLAALVTALLGFATTLVLVAAVVAFLIAYREKLGEVIGLATSRIQKISFAGVSVEIASVAELAPKVAAPDVAADLRGPIASANINDSSVAAFTDQLRDNANADFAVVDLGPGEQWLTSRLFILSIVLARMRGLKAFVFVESTPTVPRRFVGIADPRAVRWALAQRYPWFEPAFARAYSMIGDFMVVSRRGKIAMPGSPSNAYPAIHLVQNFVGQIQGPLPPEGQSEWVAQVGGAAAEHAQWLNAETLAAILGKALRDAQIPLSELASESGPEQVASVLSQEGHYVAVVGEGGIFERLLDRRALLERVARRYAAA